MTTFTGTVSTGPATAGHVPTAVEMDTWHDALAAASEPWTPYTPALTNVTLGNGTLTGKYRQVGKTVDFSISLTFGSSTAFTGQVGFGLPVTALDVNWTVAAFIFDSSNSATRQAGIVNPSTTTALLYAAGPAGPVTATVPITFAVGDIVRIGTGTYEAA